MHFTSSWFSLNLQEQKVLTAIIENPLKRSEIAKKLDVTSGAIGRSLNNLHNKGLIEHENYEYYIPNSVFKAWLKNEYNLKGVYPYKSI